MRKSKDQKREEALRRQTAYDALSPQLRLVRAVNRGGSKRETQRLSREIRRRRGGYDHPEEKPR